MTRLTYRRLAHALVAIGLACVFSILVTTAIGTYWRLGHLGTTGANGMALGIIVAPLAFCVSLAVGLGVTWLATRRGASLPLAAFRAGLVLFALAVVMFAFEMWRTSSIPREGDAPRPTVGAGAKLH